MEWNEVGRHVAWPRLLALLGVSLAMWALIVAFAVTGWLAVTR